MENDRHLAPQRAGVLDDRKWFTNEFKDWISKKCRGLVSIKKIRPDDDPHIPVWYIEFENDEERVEYLLTWIEPAPELTVEEIMSWTLSYEIEKEINSEILEKISSSASPSSHNSDQWVKKGNLWLRPLKDRLT
jgi:hypothetical protein